MLIIYGVFSELWRPIHTSNVSISISCTGGLPDSTTFQQVGETFLYTGDSFDDSPPPKKNVFFDERLVVSKVKKQDILAWKL